MSSVILLDKAGLSRSVCHSCTRSAAQKECCSFFRGNGAERKVDSTVNSFREALPTSGTCNDRYMRIGPPASAHQRDDYTLHLELTYSDTWEPPPTDDWTQSTGAEFAGFTGLDKYCSRYAAAHGLSVSVADAGRRFIVSRL
jgi:hypothetical protein